MTSMVIQESPLSGHEEIVPLSKLKVKKNFNVRSSYDGIEELAQAIKEQGQLQEILIDTENHIIGGHRRFYAMEMLYKEKQPDFPVRCLRKAIKLESEAYLLNLGENTARRSISDLDLARRLVELEDKMGIKRSHISKQTGLDQPVISKLIIIAKGLAPKVQKAWEKSVEEAAPIPTSRLALWAKKPEEDQKVLLEAYLDGDRPVAPKEKEKSNGKGSKHDASEEEELVARPPTRKEVREYVQTLEEKKKKDGELSEKDAGRFQALRWTLALVSRPY